MNDAQGRTRRPHAACTCRSDIMVTLLAPVASFLHAPKVRLPHRRTLVLLVLLGAVLMMPSSYRAGTDQAHVHTIFQGMIDAALGHSHHHADDHGTTVAPSPFARPSVPLTTTQSQAPTPAVSSDPDLPRQLPVSSPVLATSALLTLGALVVALLTRSTRWRPLWSALGRLAPIDLAVESPPPRHLVPV